MPIRSSDSTRRARAVSAGSGGLGGARWVSRIDCVAVGISMPWRASANQIRSRAMPSTRSRLSKSVVKRRTQCSTPRSVKLLVTTEGAGFSRTPKLPRMASRMIRCTRCGDTSYGVTT